MLPGICCITTLVVAHCFDFVILVFCLSGNARLVNSIWTVAEMTGVAVFSILHLRNVLRSPISYLFLTALAVAGIELPVFPIIGVAGGYASYRLLEGPRIRHSGKGNELRCTNQQFRNNETH